MVPYVKKLPWTCVLYKLHRLSGKEAGISYGQNNVKFSFDISNSFSLCFTFALCTSSAWLTLITYYNQCPCILQGNEGSKTFVHLLNCPLTATERTICCILETYQKHDGVEVPKVLQPYMGGIEFLPFKKHLNGNNRTNLIECVQIKGVYLPLLLSVET